MTIPSNWTAYKDWEYGEDFSGDEWNTWSSHPGLQDSATVTVSVNPSLIQIRNVETVSCAKASIDEYGQAYTSGNSDKLMKFELWLDATELSSFNATATEIRGYQFDLNWLDTEVGDLNCPPFAGPKVGFNPNNPDNAGITLNPTNGMVAFINASAIVDTDVSNDGAPSFIGTEQLIGTFYLNPGDNLETISLSIDDMMIVTDAEDNIYPANYTRALEISNTYATIQTDATNYLDNVSLNFFKDGVDTGVSVLVENGEITIPDVSLDFDSVKLSDASAYTSGIAADDAVDVLRDIVQLDLLTTGSAAWHSADVNNDGIIAADDGVDILRHIVNLDMIDTFDLIDNTTGERITTLDANAVDVGDWSIVANGDVDQSGGFGDAYVVPIVPVNTPPIANDDFYFLDSWYWDYYGGSNTYNVLANDFDADGDPLSVISATSWSGTNVTINADNTITYGGNYWLPVPVPVPILFDSIDLGVAIDDVNLTVIDPGYGYGYGYGYDLITYEITDGNGGFDSATVYLEDWGYMPYVSVDVV